MSRGLKWESLIQLEVQDIPKKGNLFSMNDLEWTPIGNENIQELDLCAAIPLGRLAHFIKGEGILQDDIETTFLHKAHREPKLENPTDHSTIMYSKYA